MFEVLAQKYYNNYNNSNRLKEIGVNKMDCSKSPDSKLEDRPTDGQPDRQTTSIVETTMSCLDG